MRYRAIIVSPHLDDAVFSCGNEIARLKKEGPVLVLNLFTGFLESVKDRGIVLDDNRHEEEKSAEKFLGYESHSFGELDAYFRREEYRSIGRLFKTPARKDSGEYLVSLRNRVFAYIDHIEYEQLYLPLGVGWHVDHVLTHMIFEPWIKEKDILFYEDVPYCFIPGMTRIRLNEIGMFERDPKDQSLMPAWNFGDTFRATKALFDTALMRNLRPKGLRWFALPVVGSYLHRMMTAHKKGIPPLTRHNMESIIIPIEDFSKKLTAMGCYQSQFREFFVDRNDCKKLHETYANQIGSSKPIERFWKVRKS